MPGLFKLRLIHYSLVASRSVRKKAAIADFGIRDCKAFEVSL
jgi:hypothetical protein